MQVVITSEGSTVVRFRATDNVGNSSGWVSATVNIDRTKPTAADVGDGRVDVMAERGVGDRDGVGLERIRPGGSGLAGYQTRTSADGVTWSAPAAGASATISNEGLTYVQVRSVDGAGNMSDWAPVVADRGQHGQDRPVEPDGADGDGRFGDLADELAGDGVGGGQHGCGQRDPQVRVPDVGERRGHLVRRRRRERTTPVSSDGQTLVQFRSVDNVSRVSPWVQAQVRIDTVKPSAPTVSGGSLTWKNVAQVAISASGSTDPAGGSGFAGYQYQIVDERRRDLVGGGRGQQLRGD